jgi:hypothetical protein
MSCVYDEHGSIIVQDKDDLKQIARLGPAPHEILPVAMVLRERLSGFTNSLFGLCRGDAMSCDMLNVPVIPSELHGLFPIII